MKKNIKNKRKVRVIKIITIVVLLVAIIGISWMLQKSKQSTVTENLSFYGSVTPSPTALPTLPSDKLRYTSGKNILTLGNSRVRFTLPDSWTYKKGQCRMISGDLVMENCVESAIITPGIKLSTRYGDGKEFFYIFARIENNPDHKNARQHAELIGTGTLKESSTPINGYDTFYRLHQYDGDGTTIREMNYFITKDNTAVSLYARTYEPGKMSNGTPVGNFMQFEPLITNVANSIKIYN